MTPEALDQWRWEQVIRETDSKYDRDYERVAWAREASCHHTRLVREDVRPGVDQRGPHTGCMISGDMDWSPPKPETAEPVADALRSKLRCVISHATGGHLDDHADMSLNDICVEISRFRNTLYQAGIDKGAATHPQQTEVVEALEPFAKAFEDLRYTVSGHGKRWDLAPEDEDDCGPTVYCKTERVDGASCGTSTDLELADFVRAAKLLAALKGSRP